MILLIPEGFHFISLGISDKISYQPWMLKIFIPVPIEFLFPSGVSNISAVALFVSYSFYASNTGNIFVQPIAKQMLRCKLRLFVARVETASLLSAT